jgi:hypothetical protein
MELSSYWRFSVTSTGERSSLAVSTGEGKEGGQLTSGPNREIKTSAAKQVAEKVKGGTSGAEAP